MQFIRVGWGITSDGNILFASDGSDLLHHLALPDASKAPPASKITTMKSIQVRDKSKLTSIDNLNELEYVNGSIYANVWYKDVIYKIDASTGLGTAIGKKLSRFEYF